MLLIVFSYVNFLYEANVENKNPYKAFYFALLLQEQLCKILQLCATKLQGAA